MNSASSRPRPNSRRRRRLRRKTLSFFCARLRRCRRNGQRVRWMENEILRWILGRIVLETRDGGEERASGGKHGKCCLFSLRARARRVSGRSALLSSLLLFESLSVCLSLSSKPIPDLNRRTLSLEAEGGLVSGPCGKLLFFLVLSAPFMVHGSIGTLPGEGGALKQHGCQRRVRAIGADCIVAYVPLRLRTEAFAPFSPVSEVSRRRGKKRE